MVKWHSSTTKGMKDRDLKVLFDQWRDIGVPLQPQEPPIQSVSHTALGRDIKQKFKEALDFSQLNWYILILFSSAPIKCCNCHFFHALLLLQIFFK
jgi:hypothetical protein